MKPENKIRLISVGIGAVVLCAILFLWKIYQLPSQPQQLGHGGPLESINYPAAIGTATVPISTSSTYTGAGSASSSAILATGLPNLVLAGTYTPKSFGSNLLIQVQRSIDNGNTYEPYMTITPESGDVLVNSSGTSTTNGSPFIVPGNNLFRATSGTAIGFSFDLTLVADYIKILTKEQTTSTFGTINVQALLTSN
jgi:hypothetical protein